MEEQRSAAGVRLDLEILVSYVLLVGVGAAMVLVLGGLVWHDLSRGTFELAYVIKPVNFFGFAVESFQDAFRHGYRPRLVVSLGIVILMLTPYVRVLASMIYFAAVERNVKYTIFTLVVLSALSYSLFLR